MDSVQRRHKLLEEKRVKLQQKFRDNQRKVLRLKVKRKLTQLTRLYNFQVTQEQARIRRQNLQRDVRARARASQAAMLDMQSIPITAPQKVVLQQLPEIDAKSCTSQVHDDIRYLRETGFFDQVHSTSRVTSVLPLLSRYRSHLVRIACDANLAPTSYFLYVFVVGVDVKESLERQSHPGTNANTENVSQNRVANYLWLQCFKLCQAIISHIERGHLDPVKELWSQFANIFPIFKQVHLSQLRQIINKACQISSAAAEVACHTWDHERQFISSAKSCQLSPSQMEILDDVCHNIEQVDLRGPQLASAVMGTSSSMRYHSHRFEVPPMLGPDLWRRFWWVYYDAKPKLRSGQITIHENHPSLTNLMVTLNQPLPTIVNIDELKTSIEQFNHIWGHLMEPLPFSLKMWGVGSWSEMWVCVANEWLKKCSFPNHYAWRLYENLAVLVSTRRWWQVRASLYTNSPHLLFPDLYRQLPPPTGVHLDNMTCWSDPQLSQTLPSDGMEIWITSFIRHTVIMGEVKPNEINSTYLHDLRRISKIIADDCVASSRLLLSRLGIISSRAEAKITLELQRKVLCNRITAANFPAGTSNLVKAVDSLTKLTQKIIAVYTPLLNWIYCDQGMVCVSN
ncbi:hypothetical protein DIURU_005707 [Diutina rugosa]|uniref:Uncharacterized protein n=1 Tax=Diutina rugosa TaxID=5481 RepID=A0A642UCH2_DIURU|nr:uncharacterized protein DIURU_005707 [Diutina rugosa]KAA8896695.1 hypothetical protein DIURU_005707 [Diutina rugosa]